MEQGIYAVIRSLAEAAQGLDTRSLTVLLENTAGSGAALGSRFEELGVMRQFAAELTDLKIGFCIDTCHCLASGYDVSSAAGLKRTVAEMDRALGLENVRVIHANDSKTALGSHVDRHEHIGKGYHRRGRFSPHPKPPEATYQGVYSGDAGGRRGRRVEEYRSVEEAMQERQDDKVTRLFGWSARTAFLVDSRQGAQGFVGFFGTSELRGYIRLQHHYDAADGVARSVLISSPFTEIVLRLYLVNIAPICCCSLS